MKSADKNEGILLRWIVPISACIIGLHFTCFGICGYNLSIIPGDYGDVRYCIYLLEHGFQFITGKVTHYWDAGFMYPFPNALALSENLLGSMPIYSFFRVLSYDRETSFQLWFIAVSVLNFAAAYYVLKKLINHFILATAGAYVFAFSILIYCNYAHAQVFPRFITPLVIYWILVYFENFRFKYLCFAVAGIVYQFYCGMYLGFILVLVSAALFIILFAVHFRKAKYLNLFSLSNLAFITLVGASGLVLLLPLALPYLRMYKIVEAAGFEDVFYNIPQLSSYFFSTNFSVPWRFLSKHAIDERWLWCDHQVFIGAMPWLAFFAVLVLFFRKGFSKNNKTLFAIALALLCCMLLTTRFGNFTLFKWILAVPGFSVLRAVQRVMNGYLFLFALVLCLLMNVAITRKRTLWFSLLLVAVIVDNSSNPSASTLGPQKAHLQTKILPLVEKLNHADWTGKVAFAYLSDDYEELEIQLDAMMASQFVNKPCINGYSSTSPPGFDSFWREHNEKSLNEWLDYNHLDPSTILIVR